MKFFSTVYNFMDSVIVGKGIGDAALAAVGNTGSVHFFILGIYDWTYRRAWNLYFTILWSTGLWKNETGNSYVSADLSWNRCCCYNT